LRRLATLTQGFVHDDGSGYGDVERRDLSSHGDAQEVVAGFFDEVVEAGALAAEDEDAVGVEVEVGVVGGAALVEAEDPDVLLLHLLEGADEVGDAGDADVLGGSGGGLGHGGGDGGGAALGEDDAVYADAVGCAEERSEVVRVLDAVEGEEESVLFVLFWGQEVFDSEELSLADDGQDALMGVGAGEPGELVAGFHGYTDPSGAAEFDEPLEPLVSTLSGDAYMIELARTGTDGLLDRVETVKNFHSPSLPLETLGKSLGRS
jgi:hypothetical protein